MRAQATRKQAPSALPYLGLGVPEDFDEDFGYVFACVHGVVEEQDVVHLVLADLQLKQIALSVN
jgi:hypothetical protein